MGGGFWRFVKGERELEGERRRALPASRRTSKPARAARSSSVVAAGSWVKRCQSLAVEVERGICCDKLDPGGGVVGSDWLVDGGVISMVSKN